MAVAEMPLIESNQNGGSYRQDGADHGWDRCHITVQQALEKVAAKTGDTCGDERLKVRALEKLSGAVRVGLETVERGGSSCRQGMVVDLEVDEVIQDRGPIVFGRRD